MKALKLQSYYIEFMQERGKPHSKYIFEKAAPQRWKVISNARWWGTRRRWLLQVEQGQRTYPRWGVQQRQMDECIRDEGAFVWTALVASGMKWGDEESVLAGAKLFS
ncbi:hypothetical protein CBL_03462 [Carabus blaptoides fortunei]